MSFKGGLIRDVVVKAGMIQVIILLILHFPQAYGQEPDTPELWGKAVRFAKTNQWLPGEILQKEEVFNGKGACEESSEIRIGLGAGKPGFVRPKIVRALQNGKDVTEEARKEGEKEVQIEKLGLHDPFAVLDGAPAKAVCTMESRVIEGRTCIGHRFTREGKEGRFSGTAWLEKGTGLPVLVFCTAPSMKPEGEDVTVTGYERTDRYGMTDQGTWGLLESGSSMKVEAKGLIFSFKGSVQSKSTFGRFWKCPK